MERKSQNLEFPNEFDETNENDILHRISNCLIIPNEPIQCISGEDINSIVGMPFNKSKSSFHDEAFECSDQDFDAAEDELSLNTLQGDFTNNFKRQRISSKLQAELTKYKQELREYSNASNDLEEKCLKINFELSEMQQKHDNFMAIRNTPSGDAESYSDTSTTDSEMSLHKKYTQVFHGDNLFKRNSPTDSQDKLNKCSSQALVEQGRHRQSSATSEIRQSGRISKGKCYHNESKENLPPEDYKKRRDKNLRDMYRTLRNVIDVGGSNHQIPQKANPNVDVLRSTITNLQSEQNRFRTIIEQQQHCLQDYHTRCVQAQQIMKTQQVEIEKLNSNNRQLETEITADIDQLKLKMETKLREVAQLPQLMRAEQTKNERIVKENDLLNDRIRVIQAEASHLKVKIDEIGRRKTSTMARLKTTERDLKIFKNYNIALKHEKRRLNEELQKLRDHVNTMEISSKRTMNRQREHIEKQKRDLQKRVYELEMKLNRSQNSTTSLIQERDNLIAELQTQLNTLVHNFEISQKHIRVLRRHIYSMTGGDAREAITRNRILVETA